MTFEHSPYSPDLAPVNFFLFPRFKSALKKKGFTDITDIQSNVSAELKAIPKEQFHRSSRTYILVPNSALPSMEIILNDINLCLMLYNTVFEIKKSFTELSGHRLYVNIITNLLHILHGNNVPRGCSSTG
ncbi:hypothetical protein TNCV_4051991 [Trichonephila clavipes]|nr:hypothetical protein TNCV_4051991 [Trichonephila clavipes]